MCDFANIDSVLRKSPNMLVGAKVTEWYSTGRASSYMNLFVWRMLTLIDPLEHGSSVVLMKGGKRTYCLLGTWLRLYTGGASTLFNAQDELGGRRGKSVLPYLLSYLLWK
jgi:hypothetical protein